MSSKSISKISFENSQCAFTNSIRKKPIFLIPINEIEKIHIQKYKISNFYYLRSLGMFLIVLFLCMILNINYVIALVVFVLLFTLSYFLICYRTYAIVLLLLNKERHTFYFNKINKYYFLEKIKLIREKLVDVQFKDSCQ